LLTPLANHLREPVMEPQMLSRLLCRMGWHRYDWLPSAGLEYRGCVRCGFTRNARRRP